MNKKQLGSTLIELMISMTLGLAIIAGISEIFLQSQKSAKTQTSLSHMMEDGSYVTEMLSKELRRAGFLRNPQAFNGKANNIFGTDINSLVATGGSIASASLAQGEALNGAVEDTLVMRYQLNDLKDDPSLWGSSPCTQNLGLGTTTTAGVTSASPATEDPISNAQVVTVYFYVDANTLSCRAKRELITPGVTNVSTATTTEAIKTCIKFTPTNQDSTSKGVTGSGSPCDNPAGIGLIANTERLVIKYGVDTDGNKAADYYTDAAHVSSWKQVVAAKIFLVLYSESDNLVKTAGKFSTEGVLCGTGTPVIPCPPTSNRRLYRVFSTTVAFRNAL